jgi:hypothetical protein
MSLANLANVLPNCNHIVTGIVQYFTNEYEIRLVDSEKARLLSNLSNRFGEKLTVVKCSVEPIPASQSGAKFLLITIKTYYANLLDCEIGDICYYEHHECSNKLELDDNEYHFKKIDDAEFSLWLRVK